MVSSVHGIVTSGPCRCITALQAISLSGWIPHLSTYYHDASREERSYTQHPPPPHCPTEHTPNAFVYHYYTTTPHAHGYFIGNAAVQRFTPRPFYPTHRISWVRRIRGLCRCASFSACAQRAQRLIECRCPYCLCSAPKPTKPTWLYLLAASLTSDAGHYTMLNGLCLDVQYLRRVKRGAATRRNRAADKTERG